MKGRAMIVNGPTAGHWQEREIEFSLNEFQRIVGGYIEPLALDSSKVTIYCNEEGKVHGLPATALISNGDMIAGSFVILGPVDDEGETLPLTNAALAYAKRFIKPMYEPDCGFVTEWEEVNG